MCLEPPLPGSTCRCIASSSGSVVEYVTMLTLSTLIWMFQFSGILKQSVLKEKDGNQWMNLNDDLIYENKIKLKDEPLSLVSTVYWILWYCLTPSSAWWISWLGCTENYSIRHQRRRIIIWGSSWIPLKPKKYVESVDVSLTLFFRELCQLAH